MDSSVNHPYDAAHPYAPLETTDVARVADALYRSMEGATATPWRDLPRWDRSLWMKMGYDALMNIRGEDGEEDE